jgi:hypothetical protein
MKEIPLVFGISGVARCGKDTLANHLKSKLERNGYPVLKISFATAVKEDLDPFLKEKLNISAFTEKTEEKNIIRPLLVSYATDVCRNKINKDFWINRVKPRIEGCVQNKVVVIIPDVRYENEVKWIKSIGGYVIHLTRMGMKPANFEEKANDPIIKKISDYQVRWKTFTDEKETCSYHVSKIFYKNDWSLYGEFK